MKTPISVIDEAINYIEADMTQKFIATKGNGISITYSEFKKNCCQTAYLLVRDLNDVKKLLLSENKIIEDFIKDKEKQNG